MIEVVSCFPNEGTPAVINKEPETGDIVRVTQGLSTSYMWYTETPAPEAQVKTWDAFDFKRRFTQSERIAIRELAAVNGAAFDFMDLLDTAGFTGTRIFANDADVIAGLSAFESAGVLAPGRKEEILTG